jgi:hypothetical protein
VTAPPSELGIKRSTAESHILRGGRRLLRKSVSLAESAARRLPDPFHLYIRFLVKHKCPANLIKPRTFSEKVLAKLIFDRNPLLPTLADKLTARDYIAQHVGGEYLPRLLATWRSADEVDIEPQWNRVVVKPNHGSGWVSFIPDTRSVDVIALRNACRGWLACNFGEQQSEWAYKAIPPRILAEEWIGPPRREEVTDYKFFCFDGEPRIFKIAGWGRQGRRGMHYDLDLNELGITAGEERLSGPAVRPLNFDKMLALSRTLSSGLDFLRVDMYNVDGRIYIGELTNYPQAGILPYIPYSLDELGGCWKLESMTYLPFSRLRRALVGGRRNAGRR